MIKHLLTSLTLGVVISIAIYLIGSFAILSFDITKWHEAARFSMSVTVAFFTFFYFFIEGDF